jgi:group I intron endonuclease
MAEEQIKNYIGEIYKITNLVNGKIYIGQTRRTVKIRWKEHLSNSFNLNKDNKLYQAIRKHGTENFSIETIDSANTLIDLNKKEIYWIDFFNSFKYGYNSTLGGDDNPMNYEHLRIKAGLKISKARKGVPLSPKHREKSIKFLLSLGMQYKKGELHPYSKKVYKLNSNTLEIVAIYDSARMAENAEFNNEGGKVRKHIKSKTTERNYYWIYENIYLINKNSLSNYFKGTNNYNRKEVFQLDLNNIFIKKWDTVREASLAFVNKIHSSISHCVQGKTKKAYGFKWLYKEEYEKLISS